MTIQSVPASASSQEMIDIIDQDGCIVIQDLISKKTIDTICTDLEPYFVEACFGTGLFGGKRTKRFGAALAKSGYVCQLIAQGRILELVESLLLPNCDQVQLNLTQAIGIYPGERAQILHRDDEMFPAKGFAGELMVNVMWALDDFTALNGGTQVVPGSHKWDRERLPEPHEIENAQMNRGDMLFYLGSTFHAGGENRSDEPRRGLVIGYNLGWLRQAENQYLTYPPTVARYLPKDVQQLLGYFVHRPNCGLFECQDPATTLSHMKKRKKIKLISPDYMTQDQEQLLRQYTQNMTETNYEGYSA